MEIARSGSVGGCVVLALLVAGCAIEVPKADESSEGTAGSGAGAASIVDSDAGLNGGAPSGVNRAGTTSTTVGRDAGDLDASAGAICDDACSPEMTVCSEGLVKRCELQPDGCFAWSGVPCGSGTCLDAQGCADCVDACTAGEETACVDGQYASCEVGANGCWDWSASLPCDGGNTLGQGCQSDSQCLSTFCVDGVCCEAACEAACEECSSAGICEAMVSTPDAGSCDGASECSATGRCEPLDVDECLDDPCANGGVCVDQVGDYSCACSKDYTGKDCQLPRFEALPAGFSPEDMNGEGTVVVGSSGDRAAAYSNGDLRDLGTFVGDSHSQALGVSADARVIVGSSWRVDPSTRLQLGGRAVLWSGSTLSELPKVFADGRCTANDVSADGRTAVGSCSDEEGSVSTVVQWVDGVVEDLGTPSGTTWCWASIVSDQAETVVGVCSITSEQQPLIWTRSLGMQLLAAPKRGCQINGLSADGRVGAGLCSPGGNLSDAFRWTTEGGVEVFSDGQLLDPQGAYGPVANDISADGQLVFGGASIVSDFYAVRWNYDLEPQLISDLATQAPAGWVLTEVLKASDDGRSLLGTGISDVGRYFILRL